MGVRHIVRKKKPIIEPIIEDAQEKIVVDGIIESWDEEEVDKIYNELREEYTDKEIADAFIFPGNMTKDEQESLKISMSEHKRKISKKIKPKKD